MTMLTCLFPFPVDGLGVEHVRVAGERVQVRDRAHCTGTSGGQEEILHAEEKGKHSEVWRFTFQTLHDM